MAGTKLANANEAKSKTFKGARGKGRRGRGGGVKTLLEVYCKPQTCNRHNQVGKHALKAIPACQALLLLGG